MTTLTQTSLKTNVNLLINEGKLVFYTNGKRIEITRYERWIEDLRKERRKSSKKYIKSS